MTPNAVKLAMELGSTLMDPSEDDMKAATSVSNVKECQTLINLREYQLEMDKYYYQRTRFCPGLQCSNSINKRYRPNNKLKNSEANDVYLFRHQHYHRQVCCITFELYAIFCLDMIKICMYISLCLLSCFTSGCMFLTHIYVASVLNAAVVRKI